MPTHFRSGVSNTVPGDALYEMGQLNPFIYHTLFDDFDTFTAAQWTITETQAGATQAVGDGDGGVLVLTNAAGASDVNSIQRVASGVTAETFRWAADKDMFFVARFKVSDATNTFVNVGLCITDTTPSDVTDGIFLFKTEDDATLTLRIEKNNTATALDLGEMANDTYVVAGFAYTAADRTFRGFFNGVEVGKTTTITNAPDDEDLTITLAEVNSSAAAHVLSVDYFLAAKQR